MYAALVQILLIVFSALSGTVTVGDGVAVVEGSLRIPEYSTAPAANITVTKSGLELSLHARYTNYLLLPQLLSVSLHARVAAGSASLSFNITDVYGNNSFYILRSDDLELKLVEGEILATGHLTIITPRTENQIVIPSKPGLELAETWNTTWNGREVTAYVFVLSDYPVTINGISNELIGELLSYRYNLSLWIHAANETASAVLRVGYENYDPLRLFYEVFVAAVGGNEFLGKHVMRYELKELGDLVNKLSVVSAEFSAAPAGNETLVHGRIVFNGEAEDMAALLRLLKNIADRVAGASGVEAGNLTITLVVAETNTTSTTGANNTATAPPTTRTPADTTTSAPGPGSWPAAPAVIGVALILVAVVAAYAVWKGRRRR